MRRCSSLLNLAAACDINGSSEGDRRSVNCMHARTHARTHLNTYVYTYIHIHTHTHTRVQILAIVCIVQQKEKKEIGREDG